MTTGAPFPYDASGTACVGYLSLPAGDAPAPGILVSPAFRGLSDKERDTCDRLAALGYVALGVDYYGAGTLATSNEEASGLMAALQANRPLLAQRMRGALTALHEQPRTAGQKLGAMGYCLGGKSVLDLARSGADFAAGVSLHGVYDPPPQVVPRMAAALLICDGWDDSLCPPDDKLALAKELSQHCADWQMLTFGHTGHAFTNRGLAVGNGFGYSKTADARSWRALTDFFDEYLRR